MRVSVAFRPTPTTSHFGGGGHWGWMKFALEPVRESNMVDEVYVEILRRTKRSSGGQRWSWVRTRRWQKLYWTASESGWCAKDGGRRVGRGGEWRWSGLVRDPSGKKDAECARWRQMPRESRWQWRPAANPSGVRRGVVSPGGLAAFEAGSYVIGRDVVAGAFATRGFFPVHLFLARGRGKGDGANAQHH